MSRSSTKAANPAHAPVVVLSTASPYKFPAAVLEGLGEKAEGDEFAVMEQLERLTGVPAPKNLRGLRERPVRHTTVLDREEMLPLSWKRRRKRSGSKMKKGSEGETPSLPFSICVFLYAFSP